MLLKSRARLALSLAPGLVLALLAASVARADEPEPRLELLVRSAIPARDAWERCTAAKIRQEETSSDSPETLADQALVSCKRSETRLATVLARGIGPRRAASIIAQLRKTHRENLLFVIRELRRR
jgi:hypothetical protein